MRDQIVAPLQEHANPENAESMARFGIRVWPDQDDN